MSNTDAAPYDRAEVKKAVARVRQRSIGPTLFDELADLLEGAVREIGVQQVQLSNLLSTVAAERETAQTHLVTVETSLAGLRVELEALTDERDRYLSTLTRMADLPWWQAMREAAKMAKSVMGEPDAVSSGNSR